MTKSTEGGVRVERPVRPCPVDDPFLHVMADMVSLPERIMVRLACQMISDRIEAECVLNLARTNATVAQEQFDFLMAQKA